ncbi:MAG: shikimate kinase [Caulobacter sp.]|nr:shikimate kinase [Caulobacter sp.]
MSSPPHLRTRTIALVGLMGVGKSSIGKRLATALELPFRDADTEVETAAGRSIPEIFADMGEAAFRDGERRVIARLLDEEPHVLATGGGAYMDERTREVMKQKAITVWLKADLDLLARRVARKDHRPLVRDKDPLEVLRAQAALREPQFALADIIVQTGETPHQEAVDAILAALRERFPEAPS